MGRGNIISVIPTRILHKLNQLYRHVCLNAENKRLTSLHKKQRHHCMLEIRSNAFLPQIGGGNSKCHIQPSRLRARLIQHKKTQDNTLQKSENGTCAGWEQGWEHIAPVQLGTKLATTTFTCLPLNLCSMHCVCIS